MTENEHIAHAESLRAQAVAHYEEAMETGSSGTEEREFRRAEVTAHLAQMHYLAAAVHALTAEPPGSPRTSHASRTAEIHLPVTKIGERP